MSRLEDRQTGRTSRMVAEALEAKRQLRPIKILVHQSNMIDYCMHLTAAQGRLRRGDFVVASQLIRCRGMFREDLFVDHAFYELGTSKDFQAFDDFMRWTPRRDGA